MRLALSAFVSFASSALVTVIAANASAQSPTPPPAPPPPPPLVAPAAPPPAAQSSSLHLDVATLKILRDRAQISQAEYDTALADMNEATGAAVAADAPTFVLGKFSTTFYGRAKADFIYDTTESFGDLAGNSLIARPSGAPIPPTGPQSNYAGENPRMQFSIRDSRFGFFVRAPETSGGVRVSGLLEMDFFGQVASNATETQSFSSAMTPRLRHFYFRVDNPIVDVLVGQYWHLMGWQNVYHPASVQAQGLLGELYSRDLQLRLSKTISSPFVSVQIAAAMLRPPQRDSGKPQGEAGLRVLLNKWTGLMANGASSGALQPLSVGVSGNFRDVTVPEMSVTPQKSVDLGMASIAVDGYIPIIPASADHKDNALSVHGEFVSGKGSADLYSSLTGGIVFPTLPSAGTQLQTYPQNIDNGLVTFDAQGNLHAIQWTTFLFGLQYVLPFTSGKALLAANYSHIESGNIANYTQHTAPNPTVLTFALDSTVIHSGDLYDVDLFADIVSGVQVGIEGAMYQQNYVDGIQAKDVRAQAAGIFAF